MLMIKLVSSWSVMLMGAVEGITTRHCRCCMTWKKNAAANNKRLKSNAAANSKWPRSNAAANNKRQEQRRRAEEQRRREPHKLPP